MLPERRSLSPSVAGLITACCLLPELAAAQGVLDDTEFSALLETRFGWETERDDLQFGEVIFTPEVNMDLGELLQLNGILRFRGDSEDRLEPGRPEEDNRDALSRRAFIGDDVDIELRELYLDIDLEEVFIRLGKQQVVWGEADGLKVLDVINPQSFREFILPEFEDSRIPLWSFNSEIPIGEDSLLQLLWIPDQTYDDIPEADAAFAFTAPRLVPALPAGTPLLGNEFRRPNSFVEDSDAGARFTTFLEGWELSANYFFHYSDRPVVRRSVEPGGIRLSQSYERTHLIGGSFNNAFADWVLRGEAGYSSDRFFITEEADDRDGVVESGEVSYVLGLDYQGFSDTLLSAQLFQSLITDYDEGIVQDQLETSATFLLERNFMNETLKLSLLVIQSLNLGDGVAQAELDYQFTSNVNLTLGADIFYGDEDGLYGQFRNRDRVTFGVTVGF
ncbi:DUF1302 family protein [Denitrobaculum tricleocarpae]|uniref:DUF1302 domain-containing protein n=1 Tax=Denitrobaculum tricleocarpae TaxID=2591009 RepID=A0A545TYD1_9PROT|nr:DUF1302 family protein [Denitrobaculum tricleocarpae]TQV82219.1 DUF1302 domain-containing protein [Denitrobaculum tricleocarpae]